MTATAPNVPGTNTGHSPDLDAAAHSVWLHGDWRWLTRNMTTDEKEAFADACDRHTATWAPDDQGSPVERWWRGDAPIQPQQQRASAHAYLVIYDHALGATAGTSRADADEYARAVGGIVAQVPIVADYRTQPEE